MKTLILIILVTFMAPGAFAQTVFAPIGAKWYYSFPLDAIPLEDAASYCVLLESEKDTIVQGYNCKKLKRTDYHFYAGPLAPPSYDSVAGPSVYTYVSGDTVFYYHEIFEQFVPLYFFNVAAGDTIAYRLPADTACYTPSLGMDTLFYELVDSTEVMYIDNVPLQQVWTKHDRRLNNSMEGIIGSYMERVGALNYYMLNHLCSLYTPIHTPVMYPYLCYYTDNDISYNVGPTRCDYLWASIPSISSSQNDINIRPNPVHDILYLSCDECGNILVTITDIKGAVVLHRRYREGTAVQADVRGLLPGLYFLKIAGEHGIVSFQKILKQ